MNWQPIETAPKDGSAFMVWGYYSELLGAAPIHADGVAWGVGSMRWSDTTHNTFEKTDEAGLYRKITVTDGYFANVAGGYSGGIRATHWAPMPDGPRTMPETHRGLLGVLA